MAWGTPPLYLNGCDVQAHICSYLGSIFKNFVLCRVGVVRLGMLKLVFELLKSFSEGTLPATAIQTIAAAALADGWGQGDEVAMKLAGLGNRGLCPQNALRDLSRLIERAGLLGSSPAPYLVKIPGPRGSERTVSVCLPHEYLHKMVAANGLAPYVCSDQLWGADIGVGKLLREWGGRVGVDSRPAVVVGLRSDGVSYSSTQRVGTNRSAAVAAWNCISADAAATRGKRHLFFVVGKNSCCDCGCEGFHTYDVLYRVFAWSMMALLTGTAPTRRHDDSPWTDQDRKCRVLGALACIGALLQVRGDWEWLVQAFRLRHYSAELFCFLCDATHTGLMSYLNLAENAPYRGTFITHAMYLIQCSRQRLAPSSLFSSPGFLFDYLCVDSMHAGDLGIFGDAVGGLMWVEVSSKTLHQTYDAGIDFLNEQLAM